MQVSSKLLWKAAIILMGLLLAMGVYMSVLSVSDQANAITTTQWESVAQAIDSYIDSQYIADEDGEAGFLRPASELKGQTDSSGDNVFLGEGDDMASRPVLVDTLNSGGFANQMIPATSVRIAGKNVAFNGTNDVAVKAKVDAHKAAGFSTDIITYCATGHSQTPVTMGYGVMSAAGYFGSPAPRVEGLMWGRLGWNAAMGGVEALPASQSIGADSAAVPTNTLPTLATDCGALTGGDLARCVAAGTIAASGAGSNQSVVTAAPGSYQPVDVRPSVPAGEFFVWGGNPYSINVPLSSMFDSNAGTYSNLKKLSPTTSLKVMMGGRTHHSSIMASYGARMLGYDALGFRWGLPQWNSGLGHAYVAGDSQAYECIGTGTGCNGATPTIDATAPTVSSVSLVGVTTTTADIHRSAGEPATMKIEYGTASGSYTELENDTVLNAHKTVSLTGLAPGTTYYYQVTSYDGQANGTVSAEQSFTTESDCVPGKPAISVDVVGASWASYDAYLVGEMTLSLSVTNSGTEIANAVAITGATATNGVLLSSTTPVTVGDIAGGASAVVNITYQIPPGVGSFFTSVTGSASACGTGYTYPS